MAFPDTVQLGVLEKKFGLVAVSEQVGGDDVKVLLRVAVKVTHVPGGPSLGRKLRPDTLRSVAVALAGVGIAAAETERRTDERSNTTRYVELTLRGLKSEHVSVISEVWLI